MAVEVVVVVVVEVVVMVVMAVSAVAVHLALASAVERRDKPVALRPSL